jgi:hypothetical protein
MVAGELCPQLLLESRPGPVHAAAVGRSFVFAEHAHHVFVLRKFPEYVVAKTTRRFLAGETSPRHFR